MNSTATSHRVKYAKASAELVFQVMKRGAKVIGLPVRCSLAGADWDAEEQAFVLLVESPDFPEVSDAESITEIVIQLADTEA
jgi:hypothetical protein